jgi:hypothetical protein
LRVEASMSAICPSGQWDVFRRGWHVRIPGRPQMKGESQVGHVSKAFQSDGLLNIKARTP